MQIIEGVIIEYMDSRAYQRYCLDNLLMQFSNEGMSYLDYLKEIKIENKKSNKTIDKDKNRKNAINSLKTIFGGGE